MDESGNLREILCIGNDITELRKTRDAQLQLLRFQNEMIDTAAIWIDTLDVLGNVTLWNRAAEAISGYTKEEVLGHDRIWEWLYPDPAYREKIFAKAMQILQEHHRVEGFETIIRCKNGELRHISWFSNPILDDSGRSIGSIALGADITAAKQAEEERKTLQEQLVQAQKLESIGRLAGGIAHDFNNKLQAMTGYAEMALVAADGQEPIRSYLVSIQKIVESAGNLTQQLLAFARKQIATPKVLNLNEAISGTLRMLQRLLGENISFQWKPGADLWPIKIDPTQLDQILANLCVNARDAISGVGTIGIETANMPWSDIQPHAKPGVQPGDYVRLSIEDNGTGMDSETLARIFEPFFTTKAMGKGTGLGLAMVYGIVEQNAGWITVESAPEKGTTFHIYFPRSDELPESDRTSMQAAGISSCGKETILFVEDDRLILDIGKAILERYGYDVLALCDAQQAIDLAQSIETPIHLLITDVVMPKMNGKQLSQHIQQIHPNIRSLFISGYTADIIARQGIIDTDVHFLQKPFSVETLAKKVREVLDAPM
ncbi:ATP-binding protein [Desulfatirhabdium butyrativorans]|uniref:ATP-binding protein n=1 Tax=Desulfatirhabdium butyrativorans TaxID=340467 RepID=UPI00146FC453|nr:ATP-binding protein [Desulfatirhabdium butyrativorans]